MCVCVCVFVHCLDHYVYIMCICPLLFLTEAEVLMELFLQCYYVLKFEKQTEILGCLTDLHTWHYFQFKLTSKLEISWYLKFQMTLPPQAEEVSEHVLILLILPSLNMVEKFPNFQSKTLENVNTVIDLLKLLPNS